MATVGQKLAAQGAFAANLDRNALGNLKAKLAAGQSATIQVWGDSAGNNSANPREWPYLFADRLAATYPTHSVAVYTWDDTNSIWPTSPDVVSTGTSSKTITIWNFSVPGTIPVYGMGSLVDKALRVNAADLMIMCHGGNQVVASTVDQIRGEFFAAVETYKLYHPETPILLTKELPRQADSLQDLSYQAIEEVAAIRDVSVLDIGTFYKAAGKPDSYYNGDGVHPSQLGCNLWADALWAQFQAAATTVTAPSPSTLAPAYPERLNLITNGAFRTWTTAPGTPDGWTLLTNGGSMTPAKETTIVADLSKGYSCKLLGTSNSTLIYQEVSAGLLAAVKGRYVTLAVLRYVDQLGAGTMGRFSLVSGSASLGTQTSSSRPNNVKQTGWVWHSVNLSVPPDASYLRVNLYHDTATSPTTYAAYFDQAVLVPGLLPRRI